MACTLSAAPTLPPVTQAYLLEARQMQAMSFIVHIPLVCFGIAFPAMVAFVEWRYLRTGDPIFHTLARRWTRVMVALFAAGVVTGTVLSFEMGLLWPVFTGVFGGVFLRAVASCDGQAEGESRRQSNEFLHFLLPLFGWDGRHNNPRPRW